MDDRRSTFWGKVLIAIAAGFFLLSTPCLFGAVLGFLGVLADVGPSENQQMARQALRMATYPLGVGVIVLAVGLVVMRSRPK